MAGRLANSMVVCGGVKRMKVSWLQLLCCHGKHERRARELSLTGQKHRTPTKGQERLSPLCIQKGVEERVRAMDRRLTTPSSSLCAAMDAKSASDQQFCDSDGIGVRLGVIGGVGDMYTLALFPSWTTSAQALTDTIQLHLKTHQTVFNVFH